MVRHNFINLLFIHLLTLYRVYPLEEIEIRDKMTFKSNHNLFNCSYIYKSNGDEV